MPSHQQSAVALIFMLKLSPCFLILIYSVYGLVDIYTSYSEFVIVTWLCARRRLSAHLLL